MLKSTIRYLLKMSQTNIRRPTHDYKSGVEFCQTVCSNLHDPNVVTAKNCMLNHDNSLCVF